MDIQQQDHVEIPISNNPDKNVGLNEEFPKVEINNNNNENNKSSNKKLNNELDSNSISFQDKNNKDSSSQVDNSKRESKDVPIFQEEINFNIDANIRSKFLLKVFGILLTQFIFTFGIILICQLNIIKNFLFSHKILYIILMSVSALIFISAFFIFLCKPSVVRKVPHNYIILFSITICETILLAYISILYQFEYVLGSICFVIAICLALFSISLFNKIDIKFLTMALIILLYIGIAYGIIALIVRNYYLRFLYCLLGAIIFALFIVYDTLMIRDKFDVDDYIFAALTLYFDIIRLFIEILRLLGNSERGKN